MKIDNPVRLSERKWSEDDRLDGAKDRNRGADPQRECADRGGRERSGDPELTQGEARVLA
jgi:hypothetical protein